ncbi:MAG TPA: hypothetical protein VFM68_04350 [Candidatus Saccharimonadales bacterium]|nr:hypothetical protein [Candidatus Saccharimonadales bacterium]
MNNNPSPDTEEPTAKQNTKPESAATPDTQPAATPSSAAKPGISPGMLVLQWLTYAFWGWALLALSVLTFVVIYNLINQTDTSETIPYVLAAILVLLPISLICDFFYRKHEVQKKQGAGMVVMVIHAVIFALFAIGALIASIFSLVQLMLNSGDSMNSNIAAICSFLIVAILYGLTFLRTLNPFKPSLKVPFVYSIVMLVVTGVFIILSITGPFAQSLATKQDRLIESNLFYIESGVDEYIDSNKALPDKLSDISINSSDAAILISDNLVRYEPEQPAPTDGALRYQLCVTYTHTSTAPYNSYRSTNGYSEYLSSVSSHPAGDVCYKLQHSVDSVQVFNQSEFEKQERAQ